MPIPMIRAKRTCEHHYYSDSLLGENPIIPRPVEISAQTSARTPLASPSREHLARARPPPVSIRRIHPHAHAA